MLRLFLLILLVFVESSFAQKTTYGLKAGMNIAQTTRHKQSARIAMHYGLMTNYKEDKSRFAIQGEILYSQQGHVGSINRVNKIKEFYIFDYISIPLIIKYDILDHVNLQIGPRFSFLINSEKKIKGKESSYNENIQGIRSFDFGIDTGLAYEHKSGINIGIRYYQGASELYKIRYETPTRNGLFQLSLGYFF